MKTRYLFLITLLCFALLALTCFFAARTLFPPEPEGIIHVSVPDAKGKPYDSTLWDTRLYDLSVHECYDPAPAGTVLSQSPPAGAGRKVIPDKRKCAVSLQVSKGICTICLPDLSGMEYRRAVIYLQANELDARVVFRAGGTTGTVLLTEPSAGAALQAGDTVTLTVSGGETRASIRLPDLTGMEIGEASARLRLSGLYVGNIREAFDPEIPAGSVISADAPIGASIPYGCSIGLTVSLGTEPTEESTDGEDNDGHAPEPEHAEPSDDEDDRHFPLFPWF